MIYLYGPRTNEIHDMNNVATIVEEEVAHPASCLRCRYVFHLMYIFPVEFWLQGSAACRWQCSQLPKCGTLKPFFAALSNSHIKRHIINSCFQSCKYILSKLKEAQWQDEVVVGQKYISAGEIVARIFWFSM